MAVGIIDLDRARPDDGRAPLPRRPARRVRVLAVLLLALAALAGTAPPRPTVRLLFAVGDRPVSAFALSADALFTASYGPRGNSESAIRRWRLPAGAGGWAVTLPQDVQDLGYDDTEHVLMGRSGARPAVTFLDADTGALLWSDFSADTAVFAMAGGRVLLVTDLAAGRRRVRLADARTGRELWRRAVDSAGYLGTNDDAGRLPTRLIAVNATGHTVVLNVADGAVLAEADLHVAIPAQAAPGPGADYAGVSTSADSLFVSRRVRGVTTLSSWALDSLTRRWQTTGGPAEFTYGCGPVLCVIENDTLSARDPADGRLLWGRPGLGSGFSYDDRSLLAFDRADVPQAVVLDSRTGSVRIRLGGTVYLPDVLLRPDGVRSGRTWVQARGADGALHVVGGLDAVAPYGCGQRGAYLICPTTSGLTQVWRLP